MLFNEARVMKVKNAQGPALHSGLPVSKKAIASEQTFPER